MKPLGFFLDNHQKKFHRREFLSSDPLEFVHQYQDPLDQEAVALLAALLAYGNARQVRKSVEGALQRMASPPSQWVKSLQSPGGLRRARIQMKGFVHRFNGGDDLVELFLLLAKTWAQWGSLGARFLRDLDPQAPEITDALNSLVQEWKGQLKRPRRSLSYLLSAPVDGSACKRWCMFLRWMGRQDDLDPGLWTAQSPLRKTFPPGRYLKSSQLMIPLDTHTGRISQYLGLTQRKNLTWKTVQEVTGNLRKVNANDPILYDFALSRLGILSICRKKFDASVCPSCDLLGVCEFSKKQRGKQA